MTVSNTSKRRQPSLAQLRAFSAVAEHLHFRDAAAAIGMSQPALSGAVAALEETLGVTLLERTTRKVLLSPAGERLAVRARAVLEAVVALLEEAEAVRAPFTGALRLGVIPTVAPYLLPTVLRLVHDRYPDLDLQVHEEQTANLLEGLTTGRLDLLLLAVPLGVPGVVELPLFDEDFVLVTPLGHPLGGRSGIPREALRELNLLLLDEGHCLRDQALDICREAGRGTPPSPRPPPDCPRWCSWSPAGSGSRCCRVPPCASRRPAATNSSPATSPSPPRPAGSPSRCAPARPAAPSTRNWPPPSARRYGRCR